MSVSSWEMTLRLFFDPYFDSFLVLTEELWTVCMALRNLKQRALLLDCSSMLLRGESLCKCFDPLILPHQCSLNIHRKYYPLLEQHSPKTHKKLKKKKKNLYIGSTWWLFLHLPLKRQPNCRCSLPEKNKKKQKNLFWTESNMQQKKVPERIFQTKIPNKKINFKMKELSFLSCASLPVFHTATLKIIHPQTSRCFLTWSAIDEDDKHIAPLKRRSLPNEMSTKKRLWSGKSPERKTTFIFFPLYRPHFIYSVTSRANFPPNQRLRDLAFCSRRDKCKSEDTQKTKKFKNAVGPAAKSNTK